MRLVYVSKGPDIGRRLRALFGERLARLDAARDLDHVVESFERRSYDVLLIASPAVRDADMDISELLDLVKARSPRTQILFLTEQRDLRMAMAFLNAGAYQYALLPVSDDELRLLVETAIGNAPLGAQARQLDDEEPRERFESMVGRSKPMQQVYRQIRQASATEMPVLLIGETGTGKDVAAEAIHRRSALRNGPFVAVHLGALPPELVAGELFGYERGAFTGATEQHQGRFEQAHGGSIFLDEIGTVDEKVQIALLRVIERKRFERIGGQTAVASSARLIAATNEDLEQGVESGAFREDLYYRLDVFSIELPPLRERYGDVLLLTEHFLKRYNEDFSKHVTGISPECLALLEGYPWPGNVRELKNVVQRAVLMCHGEVILPEHLPPRFINGKPRPAQVSFEIGTPLHEVEREIVLRTLAAANNNRTRAAELLGISRRALYNKLARFDI
jgi:DNA-binding NtrC family response regulator